MVTTLNGIWAPSAVPDTGTAIEEITAEFSYTHRKHRLVSRFFDDVAK